MFARVFTRFWKVYGSVEAFKFGLYLTIPVAASVFYANADFMHSLLNNMNLIKYPEEGPKPPTSSSDLAVALKKHGINNSTK